MPKATYGMLCKAPPGYDLPLGGPEVLPGWYWWAHHDPGHKGFALDYLRQQIEVYRRTVPDWRYQIVRTS